MTNKYWSKQWNFLEGCTPIRESCDNCWAESMAHRFGKYWDIPKVNTDILEHGIKKWRKPQTVFVCNTSDLCHETVPIEIIGKAFRKMWQYSLNTFLILTKRVDRLVEFSKLNERFFFGSPFCMENVFLGCTVENQLQANINVPKILSCGVGWNYWLSIEPMLGRIELKPKWLQQIKSVVIGEENAGRKSRCIPSYHIDDLCDQLEENNIPYFLKQVWAGKLHKYKYQGNLFKRRE